MRPIVITCGEPAGIAPDLIVQAAQQAWDAPLVAIADSACLRARAVQLGLALQILPFHPQQPVVAPSAAGTMYVYELPFPSSVVAGQLNVANSATVLQSLEIAAHWCLRGICAAMVTPPVQKSIINDAGFAFSGHTEFLADYLSAPLPVMMLASPSLRVALVTTHLPLAAVPAAITRERLAQTVRILHRDLQQRLGISQPRMLVLGLNPHAGEDGHLGQEEITTINPTLNRLRAEGLHLTGAVAGDTAFTPKLLNAHDVVLAMYHDQGLAPLKMQGFGEVVNITLGLSIVRTSVDHGTALPLAGTGQADASSFFAAIRMAQRMMQA